MRSLSPQSALRIAIGTLLVLATMLLGIGDRTISLTLYTVVAVTVSAYVTDYKGIFYLSQPMANFAALSVVGAAVINALQIDRHSQMIAVANLQSYLQYVLLFQPKTPRVYWQLALLSLGQVAIASTLVSGPTFGFVLLLYVFTGVVAFALLLLWSESARFESQPAADPSAESGLRLRPRATARSRRVPSLFGNVASSWRYGWSLLQQGLLITLISISSTSVIFFFLPRWNIPTRQVASNEPLRSVGFSKTVMLGELGEAVNNADVVMRVQFYRGRSQRPFKLIDEPLFRGTVVSQYSAGSWSRLHVSSPISIPAETRSPFVRQRITIEPMDVNELFAIFPVFGLQRDPKLKIDASGEQLFRQEDMRGQEMEFEIGTTGIIDDKQRRFIPCDYPLDDESTLDLLQMPEHRNSHDVFAGLRETADRVLREKNIATADRMAAAKALCDYFRESGQFFYSLQGQARETSLDPLEDFVTQHHVGHCEYYAGALVMMLRSQGIPARIAIGYKGGEWNPVGMYYQVQQLHSHAWVEVYLGADYPRAEFDIDDQHPDAVWMILDPTEGIQEGGQDTENQSLLAIVRQYLDYGHVLWNNYVAGLNSKRQRQGIYEPLAQGFQAAVENLVSPQVWQARMRAVAKSPLGAFWEWYRRYWFSWRGGLVAVGFSLFAAACYWVALRIIALLRRFGLIGDRRSVGGPPVLEIYRRLESALAKRGLERQPAQTAYEFALSAGGDLAESIEHRRVAHLPRRIVESFYRVRFGGRTLDNPEALAVEHALVELELALKESR